MYIRLLTLFKIIALLQEQLNIYLTNVIVKFELMNNLRGKGYRLKNCINELLITKTFRHYAFKQ